MFQIHPRTRRSMCRKPYLDFAGLGHIGIEFPIRPQMPGERDPVRRLPCEHVAPTAFLAGGVALVPSATNPRFHKNRLERVLANVMIGRPPGLHLFHKNGKCAFHRACHAHTLTEDDFVCCFSHGSLLYFLFWNCLRNFVLPIFSPRKAAPRRPETHSWPDPKPGRNAAAVAAFPPD